MRRGLDLRNLPAAMLLFLRDRGPASWRELARGVGFSPSVASTQTSPALEALVELKALQFVDYEGDSTWSPPTGQIRLALDNWIPFQRALNLSLSQLSRLDERAVVVRPVFDTSGGLDPAHKGEVFVMMPFSEELEAVYRHHVLKVAGELGITCVRGDDAFSADVIMKDIWDAVLGCRVVIADCTGKNPNVFYEMGIAHVIGRPVILITQDEEDVPFDLRHRRYIQYTCAPPGLQVLEESLRKTLRSELDLS